MLPEDLMKPRYITLCRYPDSPLRIGQIITGETFNTSGNTKFHCSDYPVIFKKLEWWENRKPEDMPEYLQWGKIVLKANYNQTGFYYQGVGWIRFNTTDEVFPATITEYETYINQNQ